MPGTQMYNPRPYDPHTGHPVNHGQQPVRDTSPSSYGISIEQALKRPNQTPRPTEPTCTSMDNTILTTVVKETRIDKYLEFEGDVGEIVFKITKAENLKLDPYDYIAEGIIEVVLDSIDGDTELTENDIKEISSKVNELLRKGKIEVRMDRGINALIPEVSSTELVQMIGNPKLLQPVKEIMEEKLEAALNEIDDINLDVKISDDVVETCVRDTYSGKEWGFCVPAEITYKGKKINGSLFFDIDSYLYLVLGNSEDLIEFDTDKGINVNSLYKAILDSIIGDYS